MRIASAWRTDENRVARLRLTRFFQKRNSTGPCRSTARAQRDEIITPIRALAACHGTGLRLRFPSLGVTSERVAEAVRNSLPRYDPTQHAAAEKAKLAATADGTPRSPILNPTSAATLAEPAGPSKANLVSDPNVVQLEPFTVRGHRPPAAVKLPRLHVSEAMQPSQDTSDAFLTPAERSRRLKKKHANVLTQVLNVFWVGGMAAAEEERAVYGTELNALADKIDLAAAAGASAEELKQLRELYLQLYLARPK